MKSVLLLLIGLVAGSIGAAEVYRWIDADGQVHYSDRPHEGAESFDLPEAQTFTAPVIQRKKTGADDAEAEKVTNYSELGIINPTDGQTRWNIPGDVDVSLSLAPELQPEHTVLLYLDGQTVGSSSSGDLTFKLTEVLRGTHALHAEVHDAAGNTLIESSPVSFTVLKTSVLNPNNPNNIPPPVAGPLPAG